MSMNTNTTTSKTVRSRILVGACIALLAFALAACSSSSKSSDTSTTQTPSAGATADITIANLGFKSTPVKSGATVTVKNMDDVTHTVTSDDDSSFNITVNGGETATFTAPAKAGSYDYHCNIHSSMHGTLTVS
jgi:plastocyanin